jgi:hypothetical protein
LIRNWPYHFNYYEFFHSSHILTTHNDTRLRILKYFCLDWNELIEIVQCIEVFCKIFRKIIFIIFYLVIRIFKYIDQLAFQTILKHLAIKTAVLYLFLKEVCILSFRFFCFRYHLTIGFTLNYESFCKITFAIKSRTL